MLERLGLESALTSAPTLRFLFDEVRCGAVSLEAEEKSQLVVASLSLGLGPPTFDMSEQHAVLLEAAEDIIASSTVSCLSPVAEIGVLADWLDEHATELSWYRYALRWMHHFKFSPYAFPVAGRLRWFWLDIRVSDADATSADLPGASRLQPEGFEAWLRKEEVFPGACHCWSAQRGEAKKRGRAVAERAALADLPPEVWSRFSWTTQHVTRLIQEELESCMKSSWLRANDLEVAHAFMSYTLDEAISLLGAGLRSLQNMVPPLLV